MEFKFRHCDEYIHDLMMPKCLRLFILFHRMPASDKLLLRDCGFNPLLFAEHAQYGRVRVTMASVFGDVGVAKDLTREWGYDKRVSVAELSNFSDSPLHNTILFKL